MKIIRLQAENVKKLRAVEIVPDPERNMVVIGGKNGAGKTSVLDAIEYALAGKAAMPERPVRSGETKAVVTCDLGELVVRRSITAEGGGTVTVTTKDGATQRSPQALLEKLYSGLSFDPLEFSRMKPAEQAETLRNLVGLDFAPIDAERKRIFDDRTFVNRTVKQLEAQVAGMPLHDVPSDEVSAADIACQLNAAIDTNRKNREQRDIAGAKDRVAAELRGTISSCDSQIQDLRQRIEALEQRKADTEVELQAAQVEADEARTAAAALQDVELAPLQAQARDIEATNAKVRANRDRAKREQQLAEEKAKSEKLSAELETIDQRKRDSIAAAKFPVEGLGFDESGVTYGGLPFGQASHAEQLRVSVAMGLALNPELRVLLIRDASVLDEDSLCLVAAMAAEHDAQVWLEVVGENESCSVVIEDGQVAAR